MTSTLLSSQTIPQHTGTVTDPKGLAEAAGWAHGHLNPGCSLVAVGVLALSQNPRFWPSSQAAQPGHRGALPGLLACFSLFVSSENGALCNRTTSIPRPRLPSQLSALPAALCPSSKYG